MVCMDKIRQIGSEWTHPRTGEVRYYLNKDVWMDLVGMEAVYYKTGSISGAWVDGRQISNCEAKRIFLTIDKVYVTEDGVCHVKRYGDRGEWIIDKIKAKVAELTADPVEDEPVIEEPKVRELVQKTLEDYGVEFIEPQAVVVKVMAAEPRCDPVLVQKVIEDMIEQGAVEVRYDRKIRLVQ